MQTWDPKALQVARSVQRREQPELTILFGSRARGDHDESKSDVDVMLVQATEPDSRDKKFAVLAALATAQKAYGREVPVDLVWRTLDEFRYNRRYVNSVETNAVHEGVIMPRNPESYSASDFEDEETEYEYDWANYDERLRHAKAHLLSFEKTIEWGGDDLLVGQQAQNALEHGLKALITANGGQYRNTHDIGELLGNVRHFDPAMREFNLSIPPDIYTAYEGQQEYRSRTQPNLTEYKDYLERTKADVEYIINRAMVVRGQGA